MERSAGRITSTVHVVNLVTEINLSELQKTLDAQGIELVENQKESLVGRKALADRTKGEFTPLVLLLRLQFAEQVGMRRVQEDLGGREAECIQGTTERYVL